MKNKIERKVVNLSDIKLDQSNPNAMNEKQREALNNSMEKFGYIQQIVIDKDTMQVADGEHRLKTLLERGVTEAEVVLYKFDNDTDRRIFRQIANKLHGQHDDMKDVQEYKRILQSTDMQELVQLTAISEQEILNMIERSDKESMDIFKKAEEVDKLGSLEVTCPNCHHIFKRKA